MQVRDVVRTSRSARYALGRCGQVFVWQHLHSRKCSTVALHRIVIGSSRCSTEQHVTAFVFECYSVSMNCNNQVTYVTNVTFVHRCCWTLRMRWSTCTASTSCTGVSICHPHNCYQHIATCFNTVVQVLLDIARALEHLHSLNIMHCGVTLLPPQLLQT
jgi:hypothetical protein